VLTLPRHHPPESLLLEYASGSLREPQALALATHLAYCPACRRDTAFLDDLGGTLLEALEPEPLPAAALETLLARLDSDADDKAHAKFPSTPGRTPLGSLSVPSPLRDYLAEVADPITWIPVSAGVLSLRLPLCGGPVVAEILIMVPGSSLPAHRHTAQELILVIKGSFSEESGPGTMKGGIFADGDLGEFDGGTAHTVVAGDHGCTCYRVLAGPIVRLEVDELAGPP
jgi:putative transcriptional regulator